MLKLSKNRTAILIQLTTVQQVTKTFIDNTINLVDLPVLT